MKVRKSVSEKKEIIHFFFWKPIFIQRIIYISSIKNHMKMIVKIFMEYRC